MEFFTVIQERHCTSYL